MRCGLRLTTSSGVCFCSLSRCGPLRLCWLHTAAGRRLLLSVVLSLAHVLHKERVPQTPTPFHGCGRTTAEHGMHNNTCPFGWLIACSSSTLHVMNCRAACASVAFSCQLVELSLARNGTNRVQGRVVSRVCVVAGVFVRTFRIRATNRLVSVCQSCLSAQALFCVCTALLLQCMYMCVD